MNYYLIHYKESSTSNNAREFSHVTQANNPVEAADTITGGYIVTNIKMITNPDTSYTVLKNHLHNTLGLTKADIRTMVQEAIEEIVERRMDVFLDGGASVNRIIDDAVREKSWDSLFWGDAKNLDEKLQSKVVSEVTKQLIKRIGLEVKIVKK